MVNELSVFEPLNVYCIQNLTDSRGDRNILSLQCINILYTYTNKVFTVKILKFGTPQTIAIIVLKLVKFDVTLH